MSDNQQLGTWKCPLGGEAKVFQTIKKGRHFYTQCDCCGLSQGTKDVRQQAIYDNAVFFPGVTVVKPSNVTDKQPGQIIDHEPVKVEPVARDFDPALDVLDEPVEPEKKSGGILLGLSIFGVALGVGAWLS